MKYLSLNEYLKNTFGRKVYKLSLSTGCTCPNRDGKCGSGGCIFCSQGGSGDFAAKTEDIESQIKKARALVASKFPPSIREEDRLYIAYFQSFTNTYATADFLRPIFTQAIENPQVAILSVATRPDCLGQDILDLLEELSKIKPVWVELGLQTIHEKTARLCNRGYPLKVFEKAYKDLKSRGLSVIVHVILNLPGENTSEMLETVKYLATLSPRLDGIKLQQLHILKGTKLAVMFEQKPFHLFTLEEYSNLIVKCLKLLPKDTVVHRLTGDGPKKLLIAPLWTSNKKLVINTLKKIIAEAV